jgi:hypothetical protein
VDRVRNDEAAHPVTNNGRLLSRSSAVQPTISHSQESADRYSANVLPVIHEIQRTGNSESCQRGRRQLRATCCKIRITTIQCAIDKTERAIAAPAPDGRQLAKKALILLVPRSIFNYRWIKIADSLSCFESCSQPTHGTAFTNVNRRLNGDAVVTTNRTADATQQM